MLPDDINKAHVFSVLYLYFSNLNFTFKSTQIQ